MKRKLFFTKYTNSVLVSLMILILVLFFPYCKNTDRKEGFVSLENDIRYFERINSIFRLNYDLKQSEDTIKQLGSSIVIDKDESNIRMFDVVQFGAFTRDERQKINIRQNVSGGVVRGHLTSPEYILKDCTSIQFLAERKDEAQLNIIGWKFILKRKRGESLVKAIEKEHGQAGDAHDAFGWKSNNIRYLYTLYRKAVSFTMITVDYVNSLLSVTDNNKTE